MDVSQAYNIAAIKLCVQVDMKGFGRRLLETEAHGKGNLSLFVHGNVAVEFFDVEG